MDCAFRAGLGFWSIVSGVMASVQAGGCIRVNA